MKRTARDYTRTSVIFVHASGASGAAGMGTREPGRSRPGTPSLFDSRHVTRYFATHDPDFRGQTHLRCVLHRPFKKLPPEVIRRASRKLEYIHLAQQLDDLKVPPGNRLHALSGTRLGQQAISIHAQWRICFRFEDGDAFEVEICDYH